MPLVDAAGDLPGYLRGLLTDRTHFLFASDGPEAGRCLAGFGVVLLAAEGLAEADVEVTEFDFMTLRPRHWVGVRLLAVRKAAVRPAVIAAFVRGVGFEGPLDLTRHDVFPVAEDPAFVAGMLQTVAGGKCYRSSPGRN